jgi:hypothetical protein
LLFTFSGCAFRKEVVIPRAKLQESVSKKFPYEKDVGISRFTVQTPEVYFKGKNIGLREVYFGNLLKKELRGSVDVNGNIIYRPETGAFYLHDFIISDITVNEKDLLVKVQKIIDAIIGNYLDGFRIYRLNPHDYKQNLARLYVKVIFMRNDDLVIVLGY